MGEYNQYDLGWVYNCEKILGKMGGLFWIIPHAITHKETGMEYHSSPAVGAYQAKQKSDVNEVALEMNGRKVRLGGTADDYLMDAE